MKSIEPIDVYLVDEEQALEFLGRTDLYGFIWFKKNVKNIFKCVEIPKHFPPWRYALIVVNRLNKSFSVKVSVYGEIKLRLGW